MIQGVEESVVTQLQVRSNALAHFAEWQSRMQATIASFEGFVSLEILSPTPPLQAAWLIIQRFNSPEALEHWKRSKERKKLLDELNPWLMPASSVEDLKEDTEEQGNVTEVFVTHVNPGMVPAFQKWIGKIHAAEARFPGFKKAFVQSPRDSEGSWITMLQFDTSENLDRWLNSKERLEILKEANMFIKSLEGHRVRSSFAGWFPPSSGLVEVPPLWKQTMMVLLVLFPIVMLEIMFLNPHTARLNPSLATFIGNAISVSLVSWPLMPFGIRCMRWWLNAHDLATNIKGLAIMCLIYLIEIAVFWKLV